MSEHEFNLPRADQGIELPKDGVISSSIVNPSEREWPDAGLVYLATNEAKRNPGNPEPDWEVKRYTDSGESIHFVRMNSAARGEFDQPGYLVTANVNGCTVVTAAYRDDRDRVHTYMGHYDDVAIRETDDSGKLKISDQLQEFAGGHPVRVAIAYSKEHHEPPQTDQYSAEDYPIWGLLNDSQQLADGSNVVTVPYKVSRDFDSPTIGHVGAVGRGGSDMLEFNWDGHSIKVGNSEEFTDARRRVAQAALAKYDDDDSMYFE
jgi:hypothetical protein